jgi:protein-tyrosine phosphatase
MSRSTTMVIAYLMKTFKWGFDETFSFVRFKRSIANPN